MMSWLLERGKGEAATSAFETEIETYLRSCCVTSGEWLISVWCKAGRGLGFGLGVLLSSHKYTLNIQKRNLNEIVL